jgi:hypothetical protein
MICYCGEYGGGAHTLSARCDKTLKFTFSNHDLENIEKLKEQGFVVDHVVLVDRTGRERSVQICVPSQVKGDGK